MNRPGRDSLHRRWAVHGQETCDQDEEAKPMSESQHVVIVDDEPEIRTMLKEYLSQAGYKVSLAGGGERLREIVGEDDVDLVVLDVNMPGEDGLTLAKFLKSEQPDIAIVMLTAAGDVLDRVVGLEMGADDYVAKPVDLRELLARLRAVLRRGVSRSDAVHQESPKTASEVWFGTFRLDRNAHRLYAEDGSEVALTNMEFDLLNAFADHPGQVLSRDRLLDLAHNKDWEPFDRSIDIRIARLRRKIEDNAARPQIIKTVRGAGYIFVNAG
jgi:two-component system phosphate regulon response regulator OmpR